ncbi:hypothetical protein OG226_26340 [Streptomyces sp. NBC_01261]|uniref:hypothetical protein n=1 Tax=Streptomyces sp. NBC_01261 TaxID=2903802 RepID=UPI002E2F0C8F|nr:hypothetical protein [Streptomyces sp. NBC_01261]
MRVAPGAEDEGPAGEFGGDEDPFVAGVFVRVAAVAVGVDIVAEVALGTDLALDLAVLRARGTISAYANDGGKPVELDVPQSMVLNARLQFLVLYTAGPEALAAAVDDVAAAVRDGALPLGEEHGLPLVRFPLDRTADAHQAVESGTIGKVLVSIMERPPADRSANTAP